MVRSAQRLTTPLHVTKRSNSHARPVNAADIAGRGACEPYTRKKPQACVGRASTAAAVTFSVLYGQGKLDATRLHRMIVFTWAVDLSRRYHE